MLDTYRLVGDHAALVREGLFVAEGRLVVQRLLEDGRYRVHSVLVTPSAAAAMRAVFERRSDVECHVCAPETLREITGFDFHRGCVALAYRDVRTIPLAELARAGRVLAVEGVGDPDNIGGLFRTALALGTDAVLLDADSGDPLYRKAVRTSMAATLRVPYVRAAEWLDALDTLRAAGTRVIALTPHPDALPLEDVRLAPDDRLAVLVGSEGAGLRPETLACADVRVRIPVDARADSLNVVSAAAIALYALRKTVAVTVFPNSGHIQKTVTATVIPKSGRSS